MIKGIIEMLAEVNGETEAIRIAQGKHKLSTSIKDGIQELKNTLKWRSI